MKLNILSLRIPLAITGICLLPFFGFSQVGISYHTSNSSFIGINYTLKNRLIVAVRTSGIGGVSSELGQSNLSGDFVELDAMYIFNPGSNETDIFLGLGFSDLDQGKLVVPFGVNMYPLEKKNFGLHIEISMIGEGESLRPSAGIRYRFLKVLETR